MSKLSKEYVPREVIEHKLLAALDDEGKVAIVASKDDLTLLIAALRYAPEGWGEKRRTFIEDLEQLK